MLYSYLILLKRRFSSYASLQQDIPKNKLPINKNELGRKLYLILINQLIRVDFILENNVKPQDNSEYLIENSQSNAANNHNHANSNNIILLGDCGWIDSNSNENNNNSMNLIHFNTSIAKSYLVLEKVALSRRPGLQHIHSRSIRDYLYSIKKAFPALKQSLIERYIQIYEAALFSNIKFNNSAYNEFITIFYEIVEIINGRPVSTEKQLQSIVQ
jgi:hypothetical protein